MAANRNCAGAILRTSGSRFWNSFREIWRTATSRRRSRIGCYVFGHARAHTGLIFQNWTTDRPCPCRSTVNRPVSGGFGHSNMSCRSRSQNAMTQSEVPRRINPAAAKAFEPCAFDLVSARIQRNDQQSSRIGMSIRLSQKQAEACPNADNPSDCSSPAVPRGSAPWRQSMRRLN